VTIPPGLNYPKMLFGTDPLTGRTVNLIYPFNQNHPRQGMYVRFENFTDELNYDGTGVVLLGSGLNQENHISHK
jgi:hypothetical protein